jgi:hypothetical protein
MINEELVKMARLAQRDDRMSTGALYGDLADRIEELEAKLAKAVEAAVDAGASLAAAISLLERGGRKAAPSNKMFDQMLVDYRNSLERTRATLAEIESSEAVTLGEKG